MRTPKKIYREVNNRVLILGIDALYREAMMSFEENKLLPAAKKLLSSLNCKPREVPIEGYYRYSPELAEYFLVMRTLQSLDYETKTKVQESEEYKLLYKITSSPIFGQIGEEETFFPVMKDSMYFALKNTSVKDWNAENLIEKAYQLTKQTDDCSLVGLASLARDEILITAFKESVVLYSGILALGIPPEYVYEWNVDKDIEEQANRFISIFNEVTSSDIKNADPKNAGYFYKANERSDILGRCVRLAVDDRQNPTRHYHWAINSHNKEFMFDEFWDTELWTTKMYQDRRLFLGRFNKS